VCDICVINTPIVPNKNDYREYQISEDPVGILGKRVPSPAISMFLFQIFSVLDFSNTYEFICQILELIVMLTIPSSVVRSVLL
jgi:hypothetical protein